MFSPCVVPAEMIEDVQGAGETSESIQNTSAPPSAVSPPIQEREPYKKLGLTKQVLAAHTQKEEQAFLYQFRELRSLTTLKANCSQYLQRRREQITADGTTEHNTDTSCKKGNSGLLQLVDQRRAVYKQIESSQDLVMWHWEEVRQGMIHEQTNHRVAQTYLEERI